MSSSGLIYAVIVGAWAAYLVPMWLRRQDELNEARPTERFSTAIRLLSGRAGMERRYAKDLQARSAEESEPGSTPGSTGSVDVRAFAAPPIRKEPRKAPREPSGAGESSDKDRSGRGPKDARGRSGAARPAAKAPKPGKVPLPAQARRGRVRSRPGKAAGGAGGGGQPAGPRSAAEAAARARRTKVLARRRRTTVMLFLAFSLGAIVAAVGGLAFLWAPAAPATLLSAYIVYLRAQERRRFTYTMDRRRAEAAAERLRERERQPRRRPSAPGATTASDEADEGSGPAADPELSALAADRRALVEQTDHAEWVDQQRERQRGPANGDSWDPVPVPLPTYVTAPVAPRATGGLELGAPDSWSPARSSAVEPAACEAEDPGEAGSDERRTGGARTDHTRDGRDGQDQADEAPAERTDTRRAASARRARGRGRTPLFDQYEDEDRPRAVNG